MLLKDDNLYEKHIAVAVVAADLVQTLSTACPSTP
jgi:hypothetical protein